MLPWSCCRYTMPDRQCRWVAPPIVSLPRSRAGQRVGPRLVPDSPQERGRHLRDSNPRSRTWTAGGSARAFQLAGLGSRPRGAFRSARVPKKNLAGTNGPAKFEQGGFTSTRRRVRRPLSGRKSRKLVWSKSAPKIRSDQVSRGRNIQFRCPRSQSGIGSGSSAKTAMLSARRQIARRPGAAGVHPSRPSATLRSRKSRKTLIRFDERSSSG